MIGITGACDICVDGYEMVDGHCVAIERPLMDVEDKCAYPLHKMKVDGHWTCGLCPLEAPYARFDATQSDLTTCVAYSACAYPDMHYFKELNKTIAVCSEIGRRFDFKENGINTTLVSRAVSLIDG